MHAIRARVDRIDSCDEKLRVPAPGRWIEGSRECAGRALDDEQGGEGETHGKEPVHGELLEARGSWDYAPRFDKLPRVAIQGVTPILNVTDVPQSLAWFESLGWKRGFTWNDGGMIEGAGDRNARGEAQFASVCSDEAQIFLCRNRQGSRGTIMPRWPGDDATDGVWMSWWVDSVDALDELHTRAISLRYLVTMPPTNKPWGVREFHLRHPDGHMFRISSGLDR